MDPTEHVEHQHHRAELRDWLIQIHERVLADLYCPNSEYRSLAVAMLATAGWDEHEYTAVLVALQEVAHDAQEEI